jgi:hypothetical protein
MKKFAILIISLCFLLSYGATCLHGVSKGSPEEAEAYKYIKSEDAVNQTPEAVKLSVINPPEISSNSINIFNPFVHDIKVVVVENKSPMTFLVKSGQHLKMAQNLDSNYLCLIANINKFNSCRMILRRETNYDIEWFETPKRYCLVESKFLKR